MPVRHPLARGSLTRRLATYALVLSAAFAWWLTLAPTTLGGPVGHVLVAGESMEPLLHTGDLVLTHRQGEYHIGDLVVVSVDGGHVIHRLHSGNATDGWKTKGDNKEAADAWVIPNGDIVGKQWITIPEFTTRFAFLWSQWAGPVAAASFAFVVLLPVRRRRRSPRVEAALATRKKASWRRATPFGELAAFVLVATFAAFSSVLLLLAARTGSPVLLPAGGAALAVIATVALGARLFYGYGVAEPRRSFARLDSRLVDVAEVPAHDEVIIVSSAAQLARSAAQERLPILHTEQDGEHIFAVLTERSNIEYRVREAESVPGLVGVGTTRTGQ